MESKKWYRSRTIWFNVIVAGVTVLAEYMVGDIGVNEVIDKSAPIILIIGNILLRIITRIPIK